MNCRPIQGIHGRGMGVHAHSAPTWRQCHTLKVDTSPSIRWRFIDVTPMESSKVAYYTPMPRLGFLTGEGRKVGWHVRPRNWQSTLIEVTKGDRWPINRCFLDFTIVIDCDRGHCYEHLKKKVKIQWKLNLWHIFECLCMRWLLSYQKWQKREVWDFSGPTCLS